MILPQESPVERERLGVAVKANELIQKARYKLSVEEQKIILYALSKISRDDVVLHDMEFDVLEFSRLCGLEGKAYARVKESLLSLQSKAFWIEIDKDTESCVHWFGKVHMKKGSGKVVLRFHDELAPFILNLRKRFTKIAIYPTLAMKSKYSIRLYELLKSYEALEDWFFTLDDFRKRMDADYPMFGNLRQKVLDVAVEEINLYSDLSVTWEPVKEGRKVTKIRFSITHKPPYFEEQARKAVAKKLDGLQK